MCVCVCDEMSVSYIFVSTLGFYGMGAIIYYYYYYEWFGGVGERGYLFVLHLVMNDSEGLEGGGIDSSITL